MYIKDRLTEKQGKYFKFIEPFSFVTDKGITVIEKNVICKFEETAEHINYKNNKVFLLKCNKYIPEMALFYLNEEPEYYLRELTEEELKKIKKEENRY